MSLSSSLSILECCISSTSQQSLFSIMHLNEWINEHVCLVTLININPDIHVPTSSAKPSQKRRAGLIVMEDSILPLCRAAAYCSFWIIFFSLFLFWLIFLCIFVSWMLASPSGCLVWGADCYVSHRVTEASVFTGRPSSTSVVWLCIISQIILASVHWTC